MYFNNQMIMVWKSVLYEPCPLKTLFMNTNVRSSEDSGKKITRFLILNKIRNFKNKKSVNLYHKGIEENQYTKTSL